MMVDMGLNSDCLETEYLCFNGGSNAGDIHICNAQNTEMVVPGDSPLIIHFVSDNLEPSFQFGFQLTLHGE